MSDTRKEFDIEKYRALLKRYITFSKHPDAYEHALKLIELA
jgi:hypothetical protein